MPLGHIGTKLPRNRLCPSFAAEGNTRILLLQLGCTWIGPQNYGAKGTAKLPIFIHIYSKLVLDSIGRSILATSPLSHHRSKTLSFTSMAEFLVPSRSAGSALSGGKSGWCNSQNGHSPVYESTTWLISLCWIWLLAMAISSHAIHAFPPTSQCQTPTLESCRLNAPCGKFQVYEHDNMQIASLLSFVAASVYERKPYPCSAETGGRVGAANTLMRFTHCHKTTIAYHDEIMEFLRGQYWTTLQYFAPRFYEIWSSSDLQ